MTTKIDPPSGWKYGFPKTVPENWDEYTEQGRIHWFRNNGYPQHLIDRNMLDHCWMWEDEKEIKV